MNGRRAIANVWGALGAAMALTLILPSAQIPGDALGIRRFRTPAVAPGVRVSQTFEMTANGLAGIDFRPTHAGGDVSGRVRLSLVEVTPQGDRPIAAREVDAGVLLESGRYRFDVPPIQDSRWRRYRFDVASVDDVPAAGVGVWATAGGRYDRGTLLYNGTPRWADMAFSAVAPQAPLWRALIAPTSRRVSAARGLLVIAALTGQWLALGFVLRALVR